MNNTKATISALLSILALFVTTSSERIMYEVAGWPFLVKIGTFIFIVALFIILFLHAFGYINIYKLLFGA